MLGDSFVVYFVSCEVDVFEGTIVFDSVEDMGVAVRSEVTVDGGEVSEVYGCLEELLYGFDLAIEV